MNFIEPYSDDKMTFQEGMYVLTIACVKRELDDTVIDDGRTQRRIRKNSKSVYRFIKAYGHSTNDDYSKALINKTEEGRKLIYEALLAQMEADLGSGFNSMLDQPRIDMRSGQAINEGDMLSSMVSEATKIELLGAKVQGVPVISSAPYGDYVRTLMKGAL